MALLGLVSPKFVEQAGCRKLGQKLILQAEVLLFQEMSDFALKDFNILNELHHIIESNLLYLSQLIVNASYIYKIN